MVDTGSIMANQMDDQIESGILLMEEVEEIIERINNLPDNARQYLLDKLIKKENGGR